VSLRSFTDDDKVFSITPVRLTEDHALIDEAYSEAARAAQASKKVVFCPRSQPSPVGKTRRE
jgi:hypothetical protein